MTGDTHIGLVRSSNQDALKFGPLGDGGTYYAVVCDGMGGANGGNIASNIAIDIIAQRIEEAYADGHSPRTPAHLLESAMAAANIEIFDKAKNDPTLEGMGTTVVVVIADGKNAYISHVGDSRLYLYRDNVLQQITRDHSVVQEMIESGQLTEEQARSHPRKHFITRALGVSEMEEGEYDELELHSGDKLLLCTDGLTNMVENEILSDILASGDESIIEVLIQTALDNGGSDNVTTVLFDQE
jgi:protein phosphatase